MEYSAAAFYDDLAPDYHLIFEDWLATAEKHGETLHRLILEHALEGSKNVLDCSCGIGTQSIGLALRKYLVTGSDLSPRAVERAAVEARKLGLFIRYYISDFRDLAHKVPGQFDVVISCDNSLPHLLEVKELSIAAENIYEKLITGGLFIASIRNYDEELKLRSTGTVPYLKKTPLGEVVVFQVWEWEESDIYQVKHFILKQQGISYKAFVRITKYRAYTRQLMGATFAKAGFSDIKWIFEKYSGHYQPIMIARK